MQKLSDDGVRVVYRHGSPYAFLFLTLIPAGVAVKYFLGADLLPVLVVTFMGIVMFFVGAMREHVIFDPVTRVVTCSESFLGRTTRRELIPFTGVERTSH